MNNSIIDYLNSKGQASDFASRSKLAETSGISNYSGSADQNISLLNSLKATAPKTNATTTPTNVNSMGTISIDQMQKANPIQTVTPTVDTTNYSGITGGVSDTIAKSFDSANKEYQDYVAGLKSEASNITNLMKNLTSKTADQQTANETAGVNTAQTEYGNYIKQLADLNAQASSLNREAQAIPLINQENAAGQGVTDAGLAPQNASDLRKNAIKALSIAQQSDIATASATGSYQKLQMAKEKAQQIVDLKYKPIEDELAIRQKQYDLNKDLLTVIDKKRTEALGIALQNEKEQIDTRKSLDNQKSQLQIEAAKNGASSDAINRIGNAKTLSEAIGSATTYLRTPSTEVIKMGDDRAYLVDKNTGKIIQSFGSGGGGSSGGGGGSYGGALVTLPSGQTTTRNQLAETIIASGKFTKDQASAIRRAAGSGEDFSTVVKNQAKYLLTGQNQADLENAEKSLYAMGSLDKSLKAFYDAGGSTSLLKGKYENVINKLGTLSDPKLVAIGAEVAQNLQEYRNAISGTAYGIQEGAEISSIFPSITKGQVLNNVLVQTRQKSLQNTIDGFYRSTIGDAGLSIIKGTPTGTQNQTQKEILIPKSKMSDRDFVEKVLSTRGLSYEDTYNELLDSTKASGKYKQPMLVIDNATGQYGAIEYADYLANKNKYTPM